MKVSIITVCLNSSETIEETIKSVVMQDIQSLEYIVIDGDSKDGTQDIIKKYDKYISYWCSEPDNGIYDAMNKGIRLSSGDVIGILNSDDFYEKDTLKIVQNVFENQDVDLLYGEMNLVDIQKRQRKHIQPPFCNLWSQMVIGHPATFLKREMYERYGLFDTNYRIAADFELVSRLWNKHIKFAHISRVFANFRMTGISSVNRDLQINFFNFPYFSRLLKPHIVK